MLASDIPSDVWIIISSYIRNPKDHIALSKICRSSRALYLDDNKWRQLCLSLGIGRPVADQREWRVVLASVLKHRRRCRVPRCFQFALPPSSAIGDLLPTPQAVLEHCQYFKEKMSKTPCPCGGNHSDDEEEEEEDDDEDEDEDESDEDEEDDEDEDDEDEFDDDDDDDPWNADAVPEPLDLVAALMQETFTSLMGHPPPADFFPPLQPPKPKSKSKKSNSPKITPHLLPLSWKNRDRVPVRPALHPLLVEFGSVQFQHFLFGRLSLQPHLVTTPRITQYPAEGIDWDVQLDAKGNAKNSLVMTELVNHPLLARAFATNPPVPELRVCIASLSTKITNKDGVTISDFLSQFRAFAIGDLSDEDLSELCGAHPHPGCHLGRFKTRLSYMLKDYAVPVQVPGGPVNRIRECWVVGSIRIEKGEVVCDLLPN